MAREREHRSIRALVRAEIARVLDGMGVEPPGGIMLEQPNDPSHGDLSCNVALALARPLKRNPQEIAAEIVEGYFARIRAADRGVADLFHDQCHHVWYFCFDFWRKILARLV